MMGVIVLVFVFGFLMYQPTVWLLDEWLSSPEKTEEQWQEEKTTDAEAIAKWRKEQKSNERIESSRVKEHLEECSFRVFTNPLHLFVPSFFRKEVEY